MSRREEEWTIFSKGIDVRGHKGRAFLYVNRDELYRAIARGVMEQENSTRIEVRVEVEWSDSEEAKEKQPPWVGSPAFPEWPPKERS